MDNLNRKRRSANMRQIRSKDTSPELFVRSLLHRSGYRFRLHRRDLPGKPDLVFPARRKAIFVHGCFWHQHAGCREGRIPGSRTEYLVPKLTQNRRRDEKNQALLREQGWKTKVVWECELKHPAAVRSRVVRFLGPAAGAVSPVRKPRSDSARSLSRPERRAARS